MIHQYVTKLVDNLPDEIKNRKTPARLDLVLDGGMFNGSYLVGALHFLKEMERRNYVKVERISGASIGAIVGLLYFTDSLDKMDELYNVVHNELKTTHLLNCVLKIKHYCPADKLAETVNHRLFVSYNNVDTCKKTVKHVYKSDDEVYDTIIKSCYLPFVIDTKLVYKQKYIDGITPYIFKTRLNAKVLYLDLCGYDKLFHMFNIKNETTNYHRILSGMLDIHSFYIKQTATSMCCYVSEWSIYHRLVRTGKYIYERIIVYFVCILSILSKYLCKDTIFYKLAGTVIKDVYCVLMESYCM